MDLLCGKMTSLSTVPLSPALNGFSIPNVGAELDDSEHMVRCAWFRGTDGQRSEREVIEDLLYGGKPQVFAALSCHTRLFSQDRSASRKDLSRWQKDFMKPREATFAVTEAQHWEYSLMKIAVGFVTDRLFLNYNRQCQDCARQQ